MKPETFDAWFPRLARAGAFLLGLFLATFEGVSEHSAHPILYLFAAPLIGVPVAGIAESLMSKVPRADWPLEAPSRSTHTEARRSASLGEPIHSPGTQNGQTTPAATPEPEP